MIDNHRLVELIPQLRRYARFLARDVLHADDLVQECLVRALSAQSVYDPSRSLKSWTFAIMHNLFIDGKRAAKRSGVVDELSVMST
jgi:RNA polymerase sigma-70 factor, ECF subfamily